MTAANVSRCGAHWIMPTAVHCGPNPSLKTGLHTGRSKRLASKNSAGDPKRYIVNISEVESEPPGGPTRGRLFCGLMIVSQLPGRSRPPYGMGTRLQA